jgi:hypothetical protein
MEPEAVLDDRKIALTKKAVFVAEHTVFLAGCPERTLERDAFSSHAVRFACQYMHIESKFFVVFYSHQAIA